MNESNRQPSSETPSKRRLSIGLPADLNSIAEKKPRFDQTQTIRGRDSADYTPELEQPSTATSTKFTHQSTSSYSSPSSSNGEDHAGHGRNRGPDRSSSFSTRRVKHHRRPSYPPSWVTDNDRHRGLPSGSSSKPPNIRTQSYQATSSTSVPASKPSSPPPGFNLSSGQPLVNPPQKTQAAFVGKLYSMLEDEEIVKTGLIFWSAEGATFTCPNPQDFSKAVLPKFFKHNNWQSFVRQLNMYS
ncbi:uncharacterized protein IL334_007304 [Kwoniella shivajii]|uniref:HSF-type DNA-binding domain-containing protein n=1 Tax=Kwoniella shivajii TaxID=564305 RepID=A0ABZ1D937_9TREE|nr:hypothetical protein IL334_007304 [Kwoniella shivajii]